MINFLIRILVLSSCVFSSWQITAASETTDLYQIDLIFFEHTDPKRFDAEMWPKFVGKLDTRKAIKIGDSNSLSIEAIDQSKMLLNDEMRVIRRSKSLRFIQQVAWTQQLVANVKATPIYIQAGKNNDEVQAVIDLKPSRNLFNVSFDLIYKAGDQEFRLTRDLKVKKKEVYYIDHPIIGAMLIISPVSTS